MTTVARRDACLSACKGSALQAITGTESQFKTRGARLQLIKGVCLGGLCMHLPPFSCFLSVDDGAAARDPICFRTTRTCLSGTKQEG